MHIHSLNKWQHGHRFNADDTDGERNTKRVILLTLSMMIVEISAGYFYGSMALLADGWHMGTHAVALGITVIAYYYARRHSDNPDYSFGTGKVGVLGGFARAVVLAVIALFMGAESIKRLVNPLPIHFNEAIIVAALGLIVNVVSAFLLRERHNHGHKHASNKMHHDHNLR
ncbi:MAG: cation transporter, partial [Desulfobacterales bacterium]|nr:cation transporter [Desulfobacterales bacterium]